MTSARGELRLAGAIAVAITAGVVLTALVVRVTHAAPTRAQLGFGFAGLQPRPATAAAILAANAQLLGAVIAAVIVVQSPACLRPVADRPLPAGVLVAALDALLALQAALNVLIVGAALGAYGTRMAIAVLPHGPPELAAFALALALYAHARRGRLARTRIAATAAACLALLAIAALLETYAAP